MKKVLGLDLGTNSIGWALVSEADDKKEILGMGSRIIPMSQDILGEFDKGNSISQTADRTGFRSARRLHERFLLRRERLHRVLNILGFLPEHYTNSIDFEKHFGQIKNNTEPKIAYRKNIETNKFEFVFQKSFLEMVNDFKQNQPQLLEGDKSIPYDWTIYYLRKKALTDKIEKEELAWLLLNFNQKRGYYQLRGEDEEENKNKNVEYYLLKVVDIIDSGDKKGKDEIWYNVVLENGWIYRRTSKTPLDWIGKIKEFIVTTDLDENGNIKKDKEGKEKRSFRAPQEDDWTLLKKKTENDIDKSNKTVGCYIYDTLLQKPNQKIKGKLVRTIERKFYKDELKRILEKQIIEHDELQDKKLYYACLEELYENNDAHRNNIENKDFIHLFLNDIIFYQRPLKSKKTLISNCPYEFRKFIKKDGTQEVEPIKCIAKSHPLFQEFRLWQFIHNLKIYDRSKIIDGTEVNVTNEYLKTEDDWVKLFEWLNSRKEIDQKAFLKYFKLKIETHRWNYVDDIENKKTYPCNETHALISSRLEKTNNIQTNFLTKETEEALWHILYSVEDKNDIVKALKTFASKHGLGDDFVENFKKFPPFKKEYGSYSAKAIKKLLPLMRRGKYWNEELISPEIKSRIKAIIQRLESIQYDEKKIDTISDDDIPKQILKSFINCNHPFNGLNTYQVCYAVYGRHSESGDIKNWKIPADIETYLHYEFKQHSLRNPIVEQVITETLRVVKDLWKEYGNSEPNFFDEIHIELGREMKNPADKRKQMTNQITENENTNLRIKALLVEMLSDSTVNNVRPYSPSQQEILKIYEDGVLNSNLEIPEDILKISKQSQPTNSELTKYKLWLDQKYRSPYTGETIPLNKLFTPAYEIEHIIPQSRYFDDSFSNKVICESEVNKDKDNSTAYEYIKNNSGKKIELSFGKEVTLFTLSAFEDYIKSHFAKSKTKMKKLLMEDIPESFIARQLNDSRYISKVVKGLLSNIVREEGEQETTSKNVLSNNGTITSILKQDWGLNDVWNDIITPRFVRLNEIDAIVNKTEKSTKFGEWTNKGGKQVFQTQVPLELQKGFNKKRIDHRHHALDALVIACATRNHINYLNNEYAKASKKDLRYDLRTKLCFKKHNDNSKENYKWSFYKPWETFTQDAKEHLKTIVISFKQNLRVINKAVNKYQKWQFKEDGSKIKTKETQVGGNNWAIRKSMHTPMPYGKKIYKFDNLKIAENVGKKDLIIDDEIKVKVFEILCQFENKVTATQNYLKKNPIKDADDNPILVTAFKIESGKYRKRQPISKLANRGQGGIKTIEDAIKFINKVADFSIQQDLLKYLKENENDIDKAFSPDGIDTFNSKRKIPVYRLPIAESGDKRFVLGESIGTKHKWMEAAEGTNLFFAIYIDKDGKRSYETIPLNIVMEIQKQNAFEQKKQNENQKQILPPVPIKNEKGDKLLFYLSPNDLVYIPSIDEIENSHLVDFSKLTTEQVKRIYKMVSCTGYVGDFVPNYYSNAIIKNEMGTNNKNQNALDGRQIKAVCWKLKINRIGKIVEVNGK